MLSPFRQRQQKWELGRHSGDTFLDYSRKGHDALVFLLPNKYTTAAGQHFCPNREQDLRLPAPFVDEHGFVLVQPIFQSESQPNFFAVDDATRFPSSSLIPKSWMMTQLQAPLVAQNLVAHASGQDLRHFDVD